MSLPFALTFDVEDVFHGPEVGNDDIILDIVRLLNDVGVPASFFFFGQRAQLLADRGRTDIISAVARDHAVGTHGLSPDHPTIPEMCAAKPWEDGLSEVRRRERLAWQIVETVFEKEPCGLSQHWFNAAPQVHVVAAELSKPYVYGVPAAPPLYGPTWFCGSLNLPDVGDWEYIPESDYADPARFESSLDGVWQRIDEGIANGRKLFSLVCHPMMLRCVDWPEQITHANGRNMPREKWPALARVPLRTDAEVSTALTSMRHLLTRVKNDPRLEPVTITEVHARFGGQLTEVTDEQLIAICEAQAEEDGILMSEQLSPAELCLALSDSIVARAETGRLPRAVRRESLLGPATNPALVPDVLDLSFAEFEAGVRGFLAESRLHGRLMANLGTVGIAAGLGSFYRALVEVYLAVAKGGRPERVTFRPMNRYPAAARELGHRYLDIAEDGLLDPEMDTGSLCRAARLQTWTMKPATAD